MNENIKHCTCTSEYQDQVHGKNMRVHTQKLKTKETDKPKYTCTVCGKSKE